MADISLRQTEYSPNQDFCGGDLPPSFVPEVLLASAEPASIFFNSGLAQVALVELSDTSFLRYSRNAFVTERSGDAPPA